MSCDAKRRQIYDIGCVRQAGQVDSRERRKTVEPNLDAKECAVRLGLHVGGAPAYQARRALRAGGCMRL
jgi:hypothetical protein